MRGLTLTQPWATLVALGHKRIETRSWSTSYRGELLIHAAKGYPPACRAFADEEHEEEMLPAIVPRGVILAIGRLVDVRPTEDLEPHLSDQERRYGDYAPGRFGWMLEDVRELRDPIPFKGSLGLWTVPQVVLDLIAGQGLA